MLHIHMSQKRDTAAHCVRLWQRERMNAHDNTQGERQGVSPPCQAHHSIGHHFHAKHALPLVGSGCALTLSSGTTSAFNFRASRVLAVETACSVVAYTIFSAACQIDTNSSIGGIREGNTSGVSQTAIVSNIFGPKG